VRQPILLAIAVLAASGSGCATIFTLSADRVEGEMYESPHDPRSFPRLFSGVAADGWCLTEPRNQVFLLCLLDLPLSLAADIVVSPYKGYQQVRQGNYRPRCVPEQREEIRERYRKQMQAALDLCRDDAARGIHNCGSMIAPDGTLLVDVSGGPPCPETPRLP